MNEFFSNMAKESFKELAIDAFTGLIQILPELCGYGALVTGALMMVSVLFGRSVMRPLSIYSAFLFLSICVLGVV